MLLTEKTSAQAAGVVTRPLRVLLLYAIPRLAAAQGHVAGTRPEVLDQWPMLSAEGIDVEVMDPTPRLLNPFAGRHSLYQSLDPWRALKILLLRRHVDLVVATNDGSAAMLVLLRRLFRFKVPVVIWDLCPTPDWRLRNRLQDYVVPRVDGILTIHSSQASYIASRWGDAIPVALSGYSIDTDYYRPQQDAAAEHILAVGDDAERDFATLVTAMEGVSAELVIRTRLPMSLDPNRHASVRVIRERLDFAAFRSLYARSRFVVLPLTPHPLNASGMTTLGEAFAMGKAVIVSDSDSVRDFFQPEENCIVVPAADVSALHAAIERLLREPETCERLGRNARRFAEERFAKPAFVREFAAALRLYCRAGKS
jgi:glycosyltransferase involved in cell wall biosynthesis